MKICCPTPIFLSIFLALGGKSRILVIGLRLKTNPFAIMKPLFSIIRLGWLGLFALAVGLPTSAAARTFTDTQGRKIEAEVIEVTGANVTLRLQSGKTSTIPIARLSETDRDFIALWKSTSTADTGGGSKGAPATPANLSTLIEINAKKVRVEKGQKTKESGAESTAERWVFAVEVRNKSRVNLEGLQMSYRIYVVPQASSKLAFDEGKAVYGGSSTLDKVAAGGVLKLNTEEVVLKRVELDGDYEFIDGSRNKLEDKLEGIWIKVSQGDRKVAEFKSNDSTVKKAKWSDDQPAETD
jgi:hypothetical protein